MIIQLSCQTCAYWAEQTTRVYSGSIQITHGYCAKTEDYTDCCFSCDLHKSKQLQTNPEIYEHEFPHP